MEKFPLNIGTKDKYEIYFHYILKIKESLRNCFPFICLCFIIKEVNCMWKGLSRQNSLSIFYKEFEYNIELFDENILI